MAIDRSARRAAFVLALAVPALFAGSGAAREAAPVTLAEVVSRIDASATRLVDVRELLRHDVEAELAAIDWSKEKIRRRYKVSAVVARLESASTGERTLRASCTVSAALRDERGALLAIIEGRAGAEDGRTFAARAERDALAAATRSAIRALPESIHRAE